MSRIVKQVWFQHTDGSQKSIPGITNALDLAPKMVQDVDRSVMGQERPIWRWDANHVVKITLLDEESEVRLTEREQNYSKEVKDLIQARRAQQQDAIIQVNDTIRAHIESYERRGAVKVLEWNKEVDLDDVVAQGSLIAELSPIAIADMEDRGITIPEKYKRIVPELKTEGKSNVEVHNTMKPKK